MTYVDPTHSNKGSGKDPRARESTDLGFEYGSGGRDISTEPMQAPGVAKGTSVEPFIGKPGSGAVVDAD